MNLVSRIRTQPKIVLIALILTFSVAVPLTVQTITADASTASVAKKKKKKKKKKCKKGYKKVTTKKKGKKATKCVKQKKATPKPTTPPTPTPPPTTAKVNLDSIIQWAGTKVRFRGKLVDFDANIVKCTANAGYSDGFYEPHEFLIKKPSKVEPFDEIVPMADGHGSLVGGIVVCNDVSSGLTPASV